MTQIALVADLHGNLPATMALDEDLKRRGIQKIWCLGDVIGKGPSSAETFDWAVSRCEIILQGNWDEGIGKKMFPLDEFYYNQLGEARMKRLLEFPLEHACTVSGRRIRLIHGRPFLPAAFGVQHDDAVFLPLLEPGYDALIYADVHRQGLRILQRGKMIVNTGSVGNGLGLPMVQYAVLQGEMGGRGLSPLDVNLVSLPYDREQAAADARAGGKRGLVNADLFEREILTGQYARGEAEKRST